MANLLFSGSMTPADPAAWQTLSSGPSEGESWEIASIFLTNTSGSTATVKVARVIDGARLLLYDSTIPDGEAIELTEIELFYGQSLEIHNDQEVGYECYGSLVQDIELRPEYNIRFDCESNIYAGQFFLGVELSGKPSLDYFMVPDGSNDLQIDLGATWRTSQVFSLQSLSLQLEVELGADFYLSPEGTHWVGWSKIGSADFTTDMINDAGFMAMDWTGTIYQIKRFGKNAVVYGSDGITMLYPVSKPAPTFGKQNLMRTGIKSKLAVSGDANIHYFIDTRGILWSLSSDGIEKLGYEDYFKPLKNPILCYDKSRGYLFISDGKSGYMLTESGLGGGYAEITDYINDMFVSPIPVNVDPLSVMIDTLDMGFRGLKTIESVQFGIDSEVSAFVAVDFRYKSTEEWRTSRWVRLNPEGVAFVRVCGVEFRVRLELLAHSYCEISYMNIQYKRTDHRFVRGNIGVQHGTDTAAT